MPNVLPAFPQRASHTMTIVLDEAEYVVRFTWRDRLASWWMDIYTVDGTALALGRRVSPGWGPLLGLVVEGLPDTKIVVVGSDGYARDDLGHALALVEWTDTELAAFAPTASDQTTVTV